MPLNESQAETRLSDLVAEEIRALLARRRISGREFARQMGKSPSWVNFRLTGHTPIDLNDLDEIAKALGVPIQALLPNGPASRVLTIQGSAASTVRRTPDRPHVVDARSHRGSVASAIRRPQRRAAQMTGSRMLATAGMVAR